MVPLVGSKVGGQGGHYADALALAGGLTAHLLVHANDGHADVLGHILHAVGHFTDAAAQVQHGVHAFLGRLHVHADQPGGGGGGYVTGLTHIRQNAGVLQAIQLNVLAKLLFYFLLHQLDQLRGGAGIN